MLLTSGGGAGGATPCGPPWPPSSEGSTSPIFSPIFCRRAVWPGQGAHSHERLSQQSTGA
jgi:hypothetical protein